MAMMNKEMKDEEMNGKMKGQMKGKMNNGDPVMMKDMMKKCDNMVMGKMNNKMNGENDAAY